MHAEKIESPDDPDRCHGATKYGQCSNKALSSQTFCSFHGGRAPAAQAHDRRLYLLSKVQDRERLDELSGYDQVKTLQQEIGLARMLLERRWNAVKDENDLIVACAPINQLLLTIERLIKSTNQMEQQLNLLLSRDAVIQYARTLIAIIHDELQTVEGYEEIVDRITSRMLDNQPRNTVIEAK